MISFRKVFFTFILTCLLLSGLKADETVGGIQEEIEEVLEEVYEKGKNLYDQLPPQGKFAVGAGVGFLGSRIAIKTAVSGVKIAGTAFVVSEALSYAGVFENIPDDSKALLNHVKNSALKSVNNVRLSVRRRLAPKGLKHTIKAAFTTEKTAACGVAVGALVGFVL